MTPGKPERARFSTREIDRYYLTALRWGAVAWAIWFLGLLLLWVCVVVPSIALGGGPPPGGQRKVAGVLVWVLPLVCSGAITAWLCQNEMAELRRPWVALGLIGTVCQAPYVLFMRMEFWLYGTTEWSWLMTLVNLAIWGVGAGAVVLVTARRQARTAQPGSP